MSPAAAPGQPRLFTGFCPPLQTEEAPVPLLAGWDPQTCWGCLSGNPSFRGPLRTLSLATLSPCVPRQQGAPAAWGLGFLR